MENKITPSLPELLLEEFTHRINNDIATLIAIVSREQARSSDEAAGRALRRVHARLVHVGRVQHALQGPRSTTDIDAAHYLRQLCESRRAALEDIDLSFVGCSVTLDATRCRRVGMIVSELVENARKHAFGGAKGAISVELGVLEGSIQCRVSDNGRGYSGVNRGRGLMIVYALAASLNGNMSQEHISGGTSWVLTMPY